MITISDALDLEVTGTCCIEGVIGPVSEGCRLHGVEMKTHTTVSWTWI